METTEMDGAPDQDETKVMEPKKNQAGEVLENPNDEVPTNQDGTDVTRSSERQEAREAAGLPDAKSAPINSTQSVANDTARPLGECPILEDECKSNGTRPPIKPRLRKRE